MELQWHGYRYYPYEQELAARELQALLGISNPRKTQQGFKISDQVNVSALRRLTYFSGYTNGKTQGKTVQAELESATASGIKRQSTRYSVHGLHEYKGKFNPQVVKSILNIFGVAAGSKVLDPFCGSGTTLVECAHLGAQGTGLDLNPFAVFLANAKLQALVTPHERLQEIHSRVAKRIVHVSDIGRKRLSGARADYLSKWFDPDVLHRVERVHEIIEDVAGRFSAIFLVIASNLLREYSLQDPNDLRIRRRKSPLPEIAYESAFLGASEQFINRIRYAQSIVGDKLQTGSAKICDVSRIGGVSETLYDAAITSPPYAMALPYIDTQRLSLVWLGLVAPDEILKLESDLIGSRESRGGLRKQLLEAMMDNSDNLPHAEALFCKKLQQALGPSDGFRRVAVPSLLYRYFSAMSAAFRTIRTAMKPGTPFALIVGHNRTTLGGVRYLIETPDHLASLAQSAGWQLNEALPLQTYQRYGYHMSNAVEAETLVLLGNPPKKL